MGLDTINIKIVILLSFLTGLGLIILFNILTQTKKARRIITGGLITVLTVFGISAYAMTATVTLSAVPDTNGQFVGLNWAIDDSSQPYSYQVFKVGEGEDEAQSIPTKNTVRVLNVYPNITSQMITYTTWQGQTRTISKAGAAEMWMEVPNAEHNKGYGMGLIDVEPVTVDVFNQNPMAVLKDANGTFKYDVVFFGSWDSYGGVNDISSTAIAILEEFIESGRGVLLGHDTIHGSGPRPNFEQLRPYMNIKLRTADNLGTVPFVSSTTIQVKKKGLLTSYPWDIGELGTALTIPYTHSTGQIALGDIWMDFTDVETASNELWCGPAVSDPATGLGSSNFYLTTWNNTAMIQTGHSNGEATPDEQKVLANTMFYLSQITTDTSWEDRSGFDKTPPPEPVLANFRYDHLTGHVSFGVRQDMDLGSDYSYYIKATGLNSGEEVLSETVETTVVSGIKGYAVVIDQIPDTIPDPLTAVSMTEFSKDTSYTDDFYAHVLVSDNNGNYSVTHRKVETPLITVSGVPEGWVNTDITLRLEVKGVFSTITPDGQPFSGNSYTITENGTYTFTGLNEQGQVLTETTIVIDNIDKTLPELNIDGYNPEQGFINTDVVLNITAQDTGSGVYEITLPDLTTVSGADSVEFTITENGEYLVGVRDNAGNERFSQIIIDNLDKTPPVLSLVPEHTSLTNQDVPVYITASDNCSDMSDLVLYWAVGEHNASYFTAEDAVFTTAENETRFYAPINGAYTGYARDEAGNESVFSINLDNIDKSTPPMPDFYPDTAEVIKDGVMLSISYPDESVLSEYSFDHSVWFSYVTPLSISDNTTVYARSKNAAGTYSETGVYKITNIDQTAPEIKVIHISETEPTNADVVVTMFTADTQSGTAVLKVAAGEFLAETFPHAIAQTLNPDMDTFTVTENGVYTVYAEDGLGNFGIKHVVITNIDKTPPELDLTLNTDGWANVDVGIVITATDTDSGVFSITTPDASVHDAEFSLYTVSQNGVYGIKAADTAGNVTEKFITVWNIDKTAPTLSYSVSDTEPTTHPVQITLTGEDVLSGVLKITTPDGDVLDANTAEYTATENGTYIFSCTDRAGNITTLIVPITNIDRLISVSHPLVAGWKLDPNTEPAFTANDILFENNSTFAVDVQLEQVLPDRNTETAPELVMPDKHLDWEHLTRAQTESEISLIASVEAGNGWEHINNQPIPLAITRTHPISLGVMNAGGRGELNLTAKHGLAWDKTMEISHKLIFMFTIAGDEG